MLEVIPHEDFSHTLIINDDREVVIRELTGKDIYYIELWRDESEGDGFLSDPEFLNLMIERLSVEPYGITADELTDYLHKTYNSIIEWFWENRLTDRLMSLNDWLTLCFHLSKQRWTSDLEYFESQPIIKVIQMSNIQTDFHEKVNKKISKGTK